MLFHNCWWRAVCAKPTSVAVTLFIFSLIRRQVIQNVYLAADFDDRNNELPQPTLCCALYADLRHVGSRGAHRAAKGTAGFAEAEEETTAEADPKEPHESGTGLNFAAALLDVGSAVTDPVGRDVSRVTAVDGAELGSQHDGVDEGKQDTEDVEGQYDDGPAQSRDERRGNTVKADYPGEHGDKHGEVDGGSGG